MRSNRSKEKQAKEKQTPLMRQYFEIKEQYPEAILLFRVGDFYETFADDAVLVSQKLGITLTKRNNGGDMTPLAGFPFHALDTYLPRLVRLGYRVAICEQTEDPADAKKAGRKVVEREVTEITTPGVTLSENLLDHNRNNYLLSLSWSGSVVGVAFADISTGEFALCEMADDELSAFAEGLSPAEILLGKRDKERLPSELHSRNLTFVDEWVYEEGYGYRELTGHFRTHSLKGFGVEELRAAHPAAGALLHYMKETHRTSLHHIQRIHAYDNQSYMSLDAPTRRNLELTASMQDGEDEGTLVSILDHTCTAMGGRLLRKWIMRPLKKLSAIESRLEAVDLLHQNLSLRQRVREELREVGDLERLISRISTGRTNARDLKQLGRSMEKIPALREELKPVESERVSEIRDRLKEMTDLCRMIDHAIVEEPPAGIRDGEMIREGFNGQLDELKEIARSGKNWITEIRNKLAAETGITSLKIGYNRVFGYYIEVTNTHRDKVPDHFIRKQTLTNAERYITPELKEVEEKVLTAEDQIKELEGEIFEELRKKAAARSGEIQEIAGAVAELDCLQSFAEVSYRNQYARPVVNESDRLVIRKGRHPVVEQSLPAEEPFIPNDLQLDNRENQILIITGPNMAGKSMILRQTGLIVLMAQIGCFVPAESAEIGIVDKIFTRVGASDNLAAGESTFLVEMNEAANILNNATPRSLILLDEVGRGTSTFDGLSIAWSLAEYLHNQPAVAAKTLFATHYHELNELENLYERIRNYNVQVKEHDGKVIFLRKLVRGGADHSYGIQVAGMAGLPAVVIERAREILTNLERHSLDILNRGDGDGEGKKGEKRNDRADRPRNGTPDQAEILPSDGYGSAGGSGTADSRGSVERKGAAEEPRAQRVAVVQNIRPQGQLPLFGEPVMPPNLEQVMDKLEAVDPDRLTPLDALIFLSELKRLAEGDP